MKKQKGSVLVFTLIILSFLLVASLSLATVSTSETRGVNAISRSIVAFQIADSGLETVLQEVYKGNCNNGRLDCLGGCSVVGGEAGINGHINAGIFRVVFYQTGGNALTSCADTSWRTIAESAQSEGVYNGTTRAVKIDLDPAP
jgi:Tfp pilus assembly protein PilX